MSARALRLSISAALMLALAGWAIAKPGPAPSGGGCTANCTFTGTTTTGALSATTIAASGAVTSSVASGSPGFVLPQGTRACFTGAAGCTFGPAIYASSGSILNLTGAPVATTGDLAVTGNVLPGSGFYIRPTRSTLATCAVGIEGALMMDVASGAATGNATRFCLCRSDGASVYTWQNLATGTTGTTTTCPN